MGLMDSSVFPGQSASWICEVPSTISLQFIWFLNNQVNLIETGSHMDTTANSTYTLNNVNYTDNSSTVRCSAGGGRLLVNSSVVYLTGKSLACIQIITVSITRKYARTHAHARTHTHTHTHTQTCIWSKVVNSIHYNIIFVNTV